MITKMEKPISILTSMCDNTSKMSIPSIFSLFMDIATEHAPQMGVGFYDLSKRGLFWITVKTKIKIFNLPKIIDEVTAATWPETPGRVRCNRYYTISKDGEILVTGKSEWAVISLNDGRLHKLSEINPEGLEYSKDIVCDEPYAHISEDFSDCEILGRYKVCSTDIDLGQHMNNAAYIKALFGMFSCKELEDMNICEADIAFRTPCYEGDELTVRCRKDDNALEIGILKSDGKTAATARLVTKSN